MASIKVSLSSDGQQGIKIAVTPSLVEQTVALRYFGCCWLFLVGYFDALRNSDLLKGMIWGTEFLVKEEFLAELCYFPERLWRADAHAPSPHAS